MLAPSVFRNAMQGGESAAGRIIEAVGRDYALVEKVYGIWALSTSWIVSRVIEGTQTPLYKVSI